MKQENKHFLREIINKAKEKEISFSYYRSKKIILTLGVIFILTLNFFIRYGTFTLPHFGNDQSSYIGLAMKLDKFGFQGYNLRHIGLRFNGEQTIATYYETKDNKGVLIRVFERRGINFYNQSLFHAPPLFSYLIMFSHRIFSPSQEYKAKANFSERIGLKESLTLQFYCTIIPLLSAIFVALFTFLLGKLFFDGITGFLASFLVTVSPASILASQRIWADETTTLFILLSAILGILAVTKNKFIYLLMCGVAFALSLLTKNSALIFIIPLVYMFYFIGNDNSPKKVSMLKKTSRLIFILMVVLFVTFPWYKEMISVFHSPFYQPYQADISKEARDFILNNARPWFTFLVNIPYQLPVYVFGYLALISIFAFRDRKDKYEVLCGIWFLSYLVILTYYVSRSEMLGPDDRYMLPAYPAIAILSARYLIKIRNYFYSRFRYIDLSIMALLLFCFFWSIKIITPAVYYEVIILKAPF